MNGQSKGNKFISVISSIGDEIIQFFFRLVYVNAADTGHAD